MILFYDSLKGEKILFEKSIEEEVRMYVCGPTVYDFAHLGHGRSAVAFDLIRRFLEWSGYRVIFAFNTTDIDDKMIERAEKEGITVADLAERIIPEYKADYEALGVLAPTHNPRATEYVPQMIALIQNLEKKGASYVLSDGVYFDIRSFPDYGKLSHQKISALNAGARVEERSDKRNPQDFVLWKFKKEGEPFWESPWGDGRPGWHIECSAMSSSLLGAHFDIHGGGLDLKFPHHECELAQSEKANESRLADLWMHNGYITVNEEKMSKSLGNFFTLKDIFKRYDPRVVRFFLLSTHYRSPIEYSTEALDQARQALRGLDEFYLKHLDRTDSADSLVDDDFLNLFRAKMANDCDVAGALGLLFEWMGKKPMHVQNTLESLNRVLNIFPLGFSVSEEAQKRVTERLEARGQKDWARSDALRNELLSMGYEVEDGKEGSFIRPKL